MLFVNKMDKVVVVIPIYNVESYVEDCINSVLNQTYKDIFVVLVDDGSTDTSGKICDEYKNKDSRVTVIHKANGGLSSARNVGIQWAFDNNFGEWICFVDSDDWVHPQYVEALLDAAKKYNSSVSVCQFDECQERVFGYNLYKNTDSELWTSEEAYTLRKGAPIAYAWNKLYKLECFSEIRFPEGKYWEDLFTTHKILMPLKTVPVVNLPLYFYFKNPKGIVHSKWVDKNLDYYEAHYEYVDYLRNHEFVSREFFEKALEQFVFVLFVGYKKVKELGAIRADGTPHYKIIQNYARKAFVNYNNELTKNEKIDLLQVLHPSFFDFLISLKKKLS